LFKGSWCDGAACPPGTIVSNCAESGLVGELGLPNILQNASHTVSRVVKVDLNSSSGYSVEGEIRPDLARFQVSGADPLGTLSYLLYGTAAWNLSFPSMGVLSVQLLVEGDISSARPLYCTVQLIDRDASFRYGTATIIASAPGLVSFQLSSFFTFNGFDFTGIDDINFSFTDCQFGYCNQPQPGTVRNYAVGPPALELLGPTTARRTTWGHIKQTYR
jgi:hypothetical protein